MLIIIIRYFNKILITKIIKVIYYKSFKFDNFFIAGSI